eukprot:11224243-Lingulodinium_polyedra.AAC.1
MSRIRMQRRPAWYWRYSRMAKLGLPSSKWRTRRGLSERRTSAWAGPGRKTARPLPLACTNPLSTARNVENALNLFTTTTFLGPFGFLPLALPLAVAFGAGLRKKVLWLAAHSSLSCSVSVSPAAHTPK